jgi:hypothetical protein
MLPPSLPLWSRGSELSAVPGNGRPTTFDRWVPEPRALADLSSSLYHLLSSLADPPPQRLIMDSGHKHRFTKDSVCGQCSDCSQDSVILTQFNAQVQPPALVWQHYANGSAHPKPPWPLFSQGNLTSNVQSYNGLGYSDGGIGVCS